MSSTITYRVDPLRLRQRASIDTGLSGSSSVMRRIAHATDDAYPSQPYGTRSYSEVSRGSESSNQPIEDFIPPCPIRYKRANGQRQKRSIQIVVNYEPLSDADDSDNASVVSGRSRDVGMSGSSSLMRRIGHGIPDDRGYSRRHERRIKRKFPASPSCHQAVESAPFARPNLLPNVRYPGDLQSPYLGPEWSFLRGEWQTPQNNEGQNWSGPPVERAAEYLTATGPRPYRPLFPSPRAIRLLSVAPGLPQSPLRCHLIYADFCHAFYETVSYCWGTELRLAYTEIDGIMISIPLTAFQALERFRMTDRYRLLWIDSLCINQQDVLERNQQVAMMHEIYGHGTRNLVWLGPDDGTVKRALGSVRTIIQEIRSETSDFTDFESTLRSSFEQLRLSSKGFTFDIDLEPLLRLFGRPWFSRLWVVQEATLASSNRCFVGTHEVDLPDLIRAAQWLYHKQASLPIATAVFGDFNDHIVNAALLANFCDPVFGWYKKSSQPNNTLFVLLDNLTRFETRDPRDRIFGLLGLYHHIAKTSSLDPLLQVDYEKPVVEVFRDATLYSIKARGRLNALSWTQHRLEEERQQDWPTWIPRWHRKWDMNLDARLLPTFFTADGDHANDTNGLNSMSKNAMSVTFNGFYIDGPRGCAINGLTDVFRNLHDMKIFLDQALSLYQGYCVSTVPDERDLATTLLAHRNLHNEPVTDEDIDSFRKFQAYRKKHRCLPPMMRQNSTQRSGHDQTLRSKLDERNNDAASRFRDGCWNACHRRRFFVTKAGQIGIGPQTMHKGDIVVILYGGKWPFALRPRPEIHGVTGYEFVGQCYLYGAMFGEAVEGHQAARERDVRFEIW